METYISLFTSQIKNKNNKMTIVENETTYDSQQIASAINYYKSFLLSQNLKERDRVVLVGERNLDSIAFFHALLILNMIPVLLDKTLPEQQLRVLSSDEKYSFVFSSELVSKLNAIQIPRLDRETLNKGNDFTNNNILKNKTDIIFVTHTSGTTGIPKKVAYTEENIFWAVREYRRIYKLDENDSVLFALPFHYCYAIIACCLSPLSAGKTVVLLAENASIEDTVKTIGDKKVTILVINPYFYNELCKLDLTRFDFSSVKICDSGGDVLPPPLIEKFEQQTNVLITEGYGLTETSSLTHFLLPEKDGIVKIGSVGKTCMDVEAIIVDENFNKIENGEIGELLVKGPMVISGYDSSKNNNGAFYKDWFRTGDLFYKDEEDYYYLVSRKKDSVYIEPELLKLAASSIPKLYAFREVADLTYLFITSNELYIYAVPAKISTSDRKAIIQLILRSLPKDLIEITTIKFVSSLPRTATGKIVKRKL